MNNKKESNKVLKSLTNLKIETHCTKNIPERVLSSVEKIFVDNYKEANVNYLNESISRLRYLVTATVKGIPVGFSLGDCVKVSLPRIEKPTIVVLAGLGCVQKGYRRKGIFNHLQRLSSFSSGLLPTNERRLICGRVAHPVSFKGMSINPTVVPKLDIEPTPWQQEVGKCIAQLYGVELDAKTFVVKSTGNIIGYPKIEIEATKNDWKIFERVNRKLGESLLAIAWVPSAPKDW